MPHRWFDFSAVASEPATILILVVAGLLLLLSGITFLGMLLAGRFPDAKRQEFLARAGSVALMIPAVIVPILAGSGWTIILFSALSLFCFREFARMTGLFRERVVSAIVVVGMMLMSLASLDNWPEFFGALVPITTALVAMAATLRNEPQGYIQRVSLGLFGFLLIGSGLAYLGFLANDRLGRPMILLLLVFVQLNDVFAYTCGHLFGRKRLAPATSPGKTIGGAAGAIIITTPLVAVMGQIVFRGTPMDTPLHLLAAGLIVSILGQFGDLTVSSIKRDVGVKDTGKLIPGHGGILDRCNSLLLAAPAFYYYVDYVNGRGGRLPTHLLLGH